MLTYWGFNKVAVNNLPISLFMSSTVLSASHKTSHLDLSPEILSGLDFVTGRSEVRGEVRVRRGLLLMI